MSPFEIRWRDILNASRTSDGHYCVECNNHTPWYRQLCCDCAQKQAAKDPVLLGLNILAMANASKRARRMGQFHPIIPRKFYAQKAGA